MNPVSLNYNVILRGKFIAEPSKVRTVTVPFDQFEKIQKVENQINFKKDLLSLIFYYGQNDFQPQNLRSVSVGDLIVLYGDSAEQSSAAQGSKAPSVSIWEVAPIGFNKILDEV